MSTAAGTPHYTIRRAVPADLDGLLQLENNSFNTDLLSRRRMRHWISAANGILLVAAGEPQGSRLLGYCLAILRKDSEHARLYSLAIDAAARGRGIAAELLGRTARQAVTAGCRALRLEVAESNTAAIGLYRKLGFADFARLEDYYENGETALRMQKTLAEAL